MTALELIEKCQQQDRQAQRLLYERFAPKMLGVLRRYVNRREDAEDILLEAFFKVLTNIQNFQYNGSFEGWIRRIVVNEALMFLRKNRLLTVEVDERFHNLPEDTPLSIETHLAVQDIINLLNELPMGYRTIFNLFVIEGFKHIEIAEMLGISINTSKSQLILAKEKLRKLMQLNEPR